MCVETSVLPIQVYSYGGSDLETCDFWITKISENTSFEEKKKQVISSGFLHL